MNIVEKIRGPQKLTHLRWWDILVVTIIMFGQAIYTSTLQYFTLDDKAVTAVEKITYDNFGAILTEVILLSAALAYLWVRNFDFSQWKVKIGLKTTLYGILLFIVVALAQDAFYMVTSSIVYQAQAAADMAAANTAGTQAASASLNAFQMLIARTDISSILFALLNGVYEEIYFLGMCLFVAPKNVKYAFLFSLLVRFSFHTYQGLIPAAGIAIVLGLVYYFLYEKTKRQNLYPIFLSHSIADVLGLGLISYFWYY